MWQKIQAYCAQLTRELVAEARTLGFGVQEEDERGAHLFGLRASPGTDISRVQALLAERNVVAALRGDALRISPNVYNDDADIDALREVLRAIG